jgi:hypothetical protein
MSSILIKRLIMMIFNRTVFDIYASDIPQNKKQLVLFVVEFAIYKLFYISSLYFFLRYNT